MILTSESAAATEAIGEDLASRIRPGDLVLLEGDLAAGKTTLVRGLVRGLGGDPGEVSSPTFVVIQSYACSGNPVRDLHHVDLYRLEGDPAEMRETGLEELLSDPDAVVAVEWPKHALLDWLPDDARAIRVRLDLNDDGSRTLEISDGENAL